jgi:hypothetical protein
MRAKRLRRLLCARGDVEAEIAERDRSVASASAATTAALSGMGSLGV